MNFFLIHDSNSERRKEVLSAASGMMQTFMTGLESGEVKSGNCALAWSANPKAPVSLYKGGGFTAVFGDAFHESKQGTLSAEDLFKDRVEKKLRSEAFDGYFLSVECEEGGGGASQK